MLKQGGEWKTVDWQTALEYVANGLKQIKADHGAQSIGALVSPHSTVEELYLAGALVRGLGSENIDYRLRHARVRRQPKACAGWAPRIASLSQAAARAGGRLQPAQGPSAVRAAHARRGAQGRARCRVIHDVANDWAMPHRRRRVIAPAGQWVQALADVAAAIGAEKGVAAPAAGRRHRRAPRPSPRRCWPASARPSCWATPPRTTRNASSAAGAGQLDRRADRRHRRLPDRSRQHGRRATGRRPAGRRAA